MSQNLGELDIPALKGQDGVDGEAGKILSISITMLAVGQTPYVHNSGTAEEAILDIGIPAVPGISNMQLNSSNELIITKEDGTTINAGAIDLTTIQNSIDSQIQTIDNRITGEFAIQNASISAKSDTVDTGYKAQVVYDPSTFKMAVKILNSANTVLSTSSEVDLDVGDAVESVTYDTVNERFVIVKKDGTTSYINKSTIVSDLATVASVTALATTVAGKLDTATYTSDKNALDLVIGGIQSDVLARALITETANKIDLEIDPVTFTITAKLYDKNNTLLSTSSVIDLPIESKEDKSNKVTAFSTPTDTQYPSAKLVKDQLDLKEDVANKVNALDDSATHYPTTHVVKTIKDDFETRVSLLEDIESMEELTWDQISAIVKAGKASTYFKIGDQIMTKWTDTQDNNHEYDIPLDVVAFQNVTVLDANDQEITVPGMILQWHYCSPFGVQFSQPEAFYRCENALPAGTYYFEFGNDWGNNVHSGYKYEFTTTEEIPAGGLICLTTTSAISGLFQDKTVSNWRVKTYADNSSTTPIETLTLTQYTTETPSSTLLCTLRNSTKYNTVYNDLYTPGAGSNRWKTSALRQYLNSDDDKDDWFTPDTSEDVFIMKPDQLATKDGFLKGCEAGLLNVIKPIKVATAINTTRDSEIGTWDYTFDKFFVPALEQMFINPQISGEGAYWDYWKQKSERTTPMAQGSTYPQIITYGADNHNTAQHVRLRSAGRGNSHGTWNVGTGGGIDGSSANYASRFSPACVIC
jgi:hypothetical protein